MAEYNDKPVKRDLYSVARSHGEITAVRDNTSIRGLRIPFEQEFRKQAEELFSHNRTYKENTALKDIKEETVNFSKTRTFNDLSEEDKNQFIQKQKNILPKYYSQEDIEILYENKKFLETYGLEAFKETTNRNKRQEILLQDAVKDFDYVMGKFVDEEKLELYRGLSNEGKLDMLVNIEYDIKTDSLEDLLSELNGYSDTPMTIPDEAIKNAFNNVNMETLSLSGLHNNELERDIEELILHNAEYKVLLSLYNYGTIEDVYRKDTALVLEKRDKELQDVIAQYTDFSNTEEGIDQINKAFDEFASIYMPYYKAFEGDEELENFTIQDKIRYLAEVSILQKYIPNSEMAIRSEYNERMKEYIDSQQDWLDRVGYSLQSLGTGIVAELVNIGLGLYGFGVRTIGGKEEYAEYMDSQVVNLWNDINLYGTFNEAELAKARKWGVSAHKSVDQQWWEMVVENADVVVAASTGAGLIKGGLKFIGKTTKLSKLANKFTPATLSKIETGINLGSQGLATAGMSETMSKGVFDEAEQQANALIDDKINKELKKLASDENIRRQVMTEYMNSPEVQEQFAQYMRDAEAEYDKNYKEIFAKKKHKLNYTELEKANVTNPILSKEEFLKNAEEQYFKNMTAYMENNIESLVADKYKDDLENQYALDREKAKLAAADAAATQATITAIKDFGFNTLLGQWKFRKADRVNFGKNKSTVTFDNAGKAISKEKITFKDVGKTVIKRFASEFVDESLDYHLENFSKGFGLAYFNDLTAGYYDPEGYLKSQNFTYNFLDYASEGLKTMADHLLDDEGFYEGFIGGLSGVFGINPNIIIVANPKSQAKAHAKAYGKENFKDLTTAQKFTFFANNGVVSEIADLQQDIVRDKEKASHINEVLKNNGAILNDIHLMIHNHEKELENSHKGNTTAAKDAGVRQGFELAHLLMNEDTANSPLVQKEMQELERLAKGEITEDDINQYIHHSPNKNLANKDDASSIAKEALQKNAKDLLNIIEQTKLSYSALNNSQYGKILSDETKKQLVFNKIYDFEADNRLNALEEKIKGSKVNYSTYEDMHAEFNSKQGYESMKETIKEGISQLEEQKKEHEEALKNLDASDKKAVAKELFMIKQIEGLIKKETEDLQEMESNGYSEFSERVLSKNEIMSLNPAQRAQMLNPKQEFRYNKKQQKIIKELRAELLLSNPEALILIQEAGEVYQNKKLNLEAYDRIINNHEMFAHYVDEMKRSFAYRANNAAFKIIEKDLDAQIRHLKDEKLKSHLLSSKFSSNIVKHYRETYLEEGSNRAKVLEEIEPLLKLYEDVRDVLNELNVTSEDSKRLKNIVYNTVTSSNSVEEAMTALEKGLDQYHKDTPFKSLYENVLQKLSLLKYQRDTNIIDERNKRQEKKKHKEDLKKKRKEEKKKKQKALEENDEEFKETEKVDLDTDEQEEGESKNKDEKDSDNKNQPDSKPEVKRETEEGESQSPSLAEQAKQEGASEVKNVPLTNDDDNIFDAKSSTEYTGTPWSEFDNEAAALNHYLEDERKSLDENSDLKLDYKRQYFKFIDDNKIKIQEIVDYELAEIFKNNPDVEVHFMMTPVNTNAQEIPFLVIKYTPEIEKIHKEERGGVITANGEQWLIIGNAYSKADGYIELIRFLKDDRPKKMKKGDNFYISDIYTKIKEIKSGRLVKRQLGETETVNRSISELLYTTDENGNTSNNDERNPSKLGYAENPEEGYTNIKWGIQKAYDFITVNADNAQVMGLTFKGDNQGSVFILIPTTNGKYMPAYINPVFYDSIGDKNGIKDGSDLKNMINDLALRLKDSNLEERKKAKDKLRQYLVFDDKTNIEIGSKDIPTLTVVRNGIRVNTYSIEKGVDIIKILKDLNPRINITVSTLSDNFLMKMFEDAGALTTDISLLHTRNGSFTIFPVDANGKIDEGDVTPHNSNNEKHRIREQRIPLNGVQYAFYDNVWHDENDNVVTDAELIQNIEYKKAIRGRTEEFTSKSGDNYHILSDDPSNPIVLRVDNKGQITKQSKEEANNIITRYKADLEDKKTAQNSREEIKLEESKEENKPESIPAVNPTEQLFGNFDSETKTVTKETITQTTEHKEVTEDKDKKQPNNLDNTKDLTTFDTLFKKTSFKGPLKAIFKEKAKTDSSWKWGRNSSDVAKVLESKGVSLLNIDNVEDWLNMIKNCK